MTDAGTRRLEWLLCALLAAVVLAVFSPALFCNLTDYDDLAYVITNRNIQHGLNWKMVQWALLNPWDGNWHPLTWISHAIDFQLYGLNPAGHHLTNIVVHAANAVLLFLLLRRLTSALWRSAFVAVMFAVHPLRVESVVWVAERKDVLSTFFWLLAVWAYVGYAKPGAHGARDLPWGQGKEKTRRPLFYLLALGLFACALMCKAMVVTLPFVLLLLDYWPLGRLRFGLEFKRSLITEKILFLTLSLAASVITWVVQKQVGLVISLQDLPLSARLASIPCAYVRYVAKNFWPSGLAVLYPQRPVGVLEFLGCATVLAVLSFWAVTRRQTQPYLVVGWCWFLGMLVPVIGIVQVSIQSMADRYSYLPSVGLWIMVAWGAWDWLGRRAEGRAVLATAGACAAGICAILSPLQIRYWENTTVLFQRAAEVANPEYLPNYSKGREAEENGDYASAVYYLEKALSHENENVPLANHARAYNDLGSVYLLQGKIEGAVACFEKALALQPKFPQAYYNLGRAFLAHHQPEVAADALQQALALDPGAAAAHYELAGSLSLLGRPAEAIKEYSQALKLSPGMDEAANGLAWLLANSAERSLRDGPRAVSLAEQAVQHTHRRNPVVLATLGAAYAETGRTNEALATVEEAHRLALAQNNSAMAAVLQAQAEQYQAQARKKP